MKFHSTIIFLINLETITNQRKASSINLSIIIFVLNSQPLNYLPNSSNKKTDKTLKKILKKDVIDFDTLNKKINKSLLPVLQNKTYFKSVQNLYSVLPETTTHKKIVEKPSTTNEEHYNTESESKKEPIKNKSDRLSRK